MTSEEDVAEDAEVLEERGAGEPADVRAGGEAVPLSGVGRGGDRLRLPRHRRKRQAVPWEGRPQRADLLCAAGLLVFLVYSLALIPAVPRLVGSHPVALELLSGSLPAMVTAGALARVGGTSLLVAFAAAVPGTMMFDWLFWWAGRRWGHRGALLLVGQGPRQARWVARAERLGARWGGLAIVIGYYLPIPNVVIYALVGLSGMGLGRFLAWDVLGAAVWSGLIVGLGYAIGRRAVDVAHAVTHYSLLATLVLVALVFARQAVLRRG